MAKMFSQVFSTDKSADAADTSNEFEPIGGGDPSAPDDGDDGGPPSEVASSSSGEIGNEYQPIGGDPVDPGSPIA